MGSATTRGRVTSRTAMSSPAIAPMVIGLLNIRRTLRSSIQTFAAGIAVEECHVDRCDDEQLHEQGGRHQRRVAEDVAREGCRGCRR